LAELISHSPNAEMARKGLGDMTTSQKHFTQMTKAMVAVGTAWALSLSLAGHAQADAAVTKRQTELRQGPGETARSLRALPPNTAVTRLTERMGPWLQVKVGPTDSEVVGWLHMFDLGAAHTGALATAGHASAGFLRGVTQLFQPNRDARGTTVATATVGIRGLGVEDLASVTPDRAAVEQAESFRLDSIQTEQFAKTSGWTTQVVSALPVPVAQVPSTNPNAEGAR
jgi:hypothetical protein